MRGDRRELGWHGWAACVVGVSLLALVACRAKPTPPPPPQAAPAAADSDEPATPGWERLPPPADLPRNRPLRAAFLTVEGVRGAELLAAYDVLRSTTAQPGIEVLAVSPDGAPVTTAEGLRLTPQAGLGQAGAVDILVVPGSQHGRDSDLANPALVDWVRRTGEKAYFVVSLSDGAFLLAAAGLLDGHAATTFPAGQDAFAQRFPEIELRRGVSFVHDGKAITAEGGARSYDPAMYLVDHLFGEKVTQDVGRGLVIDWPPTAEAMPASIVLSTPPAP